MAKVLRASGPTVTYPYNTLESQVRDYWGGDLDNERNFPISYWKIEQLLNASPSGEIAIQDRKSVV